MPAPVPPISDVRALPSDQWDLVLRPKAGWFDLHLADLWRYRDLVLLFIWRDFAATYKQTILGPLWYIITPVFTTLSFTLVFGQIAQISTDGLPQILFYMLGITFWTYFSDCLNRTAGTFLSNAGIFGKVYFPRLSVPLSTVVSNLIKFGIQLALFLAFLAVYYFRGANVHPQWAVLLTPVLILMLGAFGLGAGIIVSALTTKYRDFQLLISFGVQLFMYATPIIYPLSAIPAKYRWLIVLNPMTSIVEALRFAFLGTGALDYAHLAYSAGFIGVVLFLGILLFSHVERTFMDTV